LRIWTSGNAKGSGRLSDSFCWLNAINYYEDALIQYCLELPSSRNPYKALYRAAKLGYTVTTDYWTSQSICPANIQYDLAYYFGVNTEYPFSFGYHAMRITNVKVMRNVEKWLSWFSCTALSYWILANFTCWVNLLWHYSNGFYCWLLESFQHYHIQTILSFDMV
jgi:hypothetical protein